MARCHIELYTPGRTSEVSRLVIAIPDTPAARSRLKKNRANRKGSYIKRHCPTGGEQTILRFDGRSWR